MSKFRDRLARIAGWQDADYDGDRGEDLMSHFEVINLPQPDAIASEANRLGDIMFGGITGEHSQVANFHFAIACAGWQAAIARVADVLGVDAAALDSTVGWPLGEPEDCVPLVGKSLSIELLNAEARIAKRTAEKVVAIRSTPDASATTPPKPLGQP